jgi:hypothetical protein
LPHALRRHFSPSEAPPAPLPPRSLTVPLPRSAGEDGASAALFEDEDAADKSVTRAGDFNNLGAILRANRRSVGARSSLSSRRVKFASAFVKRRQVPSSFVKAFLDKTSGNFKGLRRRALTNGPRRENVLPRDRLRLADLKSMIARFRQFGKTLSRSRRRARR